MPARCSWDDGYTYAPEPVYNSTTGTCQNAVLDVHYNFTWRANQIIYLEATVMLGKFNKCLMVYGLLVYLHKGNAKAQAISIVDRCYF